MTDAFLYAVKAHIDWCSCCLISTNTHLSPVFLTCSVHIESVLRLFVAIWCKKQLSAIILLESSLV